MKKTTLLQIQQGIADFNLVGINRVDPLWHKFLLDIRTIYVVTIYSRNLCEKKSLTLIPRGKVKVDLDNFNVILCNNVLHAILYIYIIL